MTEDWVSHVIVCGLHGEGLRTIEQLHLAGVRVVVVDDRPDPRLVRIVQGWGLPHLEQDSRAPRTLVAAGLAGAAALICAESDDLHTLETALLARELRPDARVVVQIRNPAVGRAVASTGVSVLDVAGLSAPSLVEACLQTGNHEVEILGVRFLAVTVRAAGAGRGTLRDRYGDLAPVAVRPIEGEMAICPGRDLRVAAGDEVTVLGTPAQLRAAQVLPPEKVPRLLVGARYGGAKYDTDDLDGDRDHLRTARLGPIRWLGNVVRLLGSTLDRKVWAVLVALFGLVTLSTMVLRLGYHEPDGREMTVLDALYFTVETIATVGYGDFSFRDQHPALRLYAIGLMIVGAIMATAFFALLTNVLVSRRIEESLGRLRVTRLSGHVVVVGLGSIGIRVVELLVRQGTQVVVVEPDQNNRYLAQARGLGVPVVDGDATQAEVLELVHLSHATAVAVLTSDDLVNIETGLAVRDLLAASAVPSAQIPLVLRLFDRRLAESLQAGFGFSAVQSTAALAAPWFVGAALGLEVLSTFYVGDLPMLVASLRITAEGGLDGLAMQELAARTRVVALHRPGGELEHPPRRDTRFSAGDVAFLVGTYEDLLQVLRRNASVAA
ncbi:MAG TPA: NAD-binding protein [Kineosporiaceae bacterium]|nr:NAD-binding protein [Kineosporiaceae bacterium]